MTKHLSRIPDDQLLFWRLIDAMDIPLAKEIEKAELAPERLSQMLVKCAHCAQPQSCARFLAAREAHTSEPPHFCANRAAILRLGALHRTGEATPADR